MTNRVSINLTQDQFNILFDLFPYDPELQREACFQALRLPELSIPNPTGTDAQGRKVYMDNGFMGSGYTLLRDAIGTNSTNVVHPITWDEDPVRRRINEIHGLLWKRIRGN